MRGMELEGVEFTPVSEKEVPASLLAGALITVLLVAGTAIPLVLKLTGVWAGLWGWLAWGLPGVVLLWCLVDLALTPRQVRARGYAEREDDILWREGLLVRTVKAVPYGRLQYVDIEEGPIARRFGVQKVTLKTAGADLEMSGLSTAESARLREVLMRRGQARLAGL